MAVKVEVAPEEYKPVSDSQARHIIENVMSLCKDLDHISDEELIDRVWTIREYLEDADILA